MDPVGATVALAIAASAFYRTASGKREALTAGLWAAALAFVIAALLPLRVSDDIAWVDNLAQVVCFLAFVASSYLIARMTYYVARIESHWPATFTATSVAGMIVLYCATELHSTRAPIEASPGAASAWFAVAAAVGLLPTHIAAIVGVMQIRNKDNLMVWLLAIYGAVGAVYPLLTVANHIGTGDTRWTPSFYYPVVWFILLISFGALSVAGVIGASRAKQDGHVGVELAASA